MQSCRSQTGETIGLIDAAIVALRFAARNITRRPEVQEALRDFYADPEVRAVFRHAQNATHDRRLVLIRKGNLTKAERTELTALDAFVADLPTGDPEHDKVHAILKLAYYLTLDRAKTACRV